MNAAITIGVNTTSTILTKLPPGRPKTALHAPAACKPRPLTRPSSLRYPPRSLFDALDMLRLLPMTMLRLLTSTRGMFAVFAVFAMLFSCPATGVRDSHFQVGVLVQA